MDKINLYRIVEAMPAQNLAGHPNDQRLPKPTGAKSPVGEHLQKTDAERTAYARRNNLRIGTQIDTYA